MVNKELYGRGSRRPSAPSSELPAQTPLIFKLHEGKLHEGEVLYRHRQSVHDSLFFGTTGNYRFDDPGCPAPGSFGVLYAGADPECRLLESCGSTTGIPAVSDVYLDARQIARMEPTTGSRQALIKSLNNGPRY